MSCTECLLQIFIISIFTSAILHTQRSLHKAYEEHERIKIAASETLQTIKCQRTTPGYLECFNKRYGDAILFYTGF